MPRLAFIGNPNSGKSTLFNALTGATQTIGNWSGVTVEQMSGYYDYQNIRYECIDLPGVYSLINYQDDQALDEIIVTEFLAKEPIDLLVNILDATQLERHLYLSLQCRELNIPMIVVVNMMDIAKAQQIQVDLAELARALQCKVIAVTAHKQVGIEALRTAIASQVQRTPSPWFVTLPPLLEQAQQQVLALLPDHLQHAWCANRLLSGDTQLLALLSDPVRQQWHRLNSELRQQLGEDVDIAIADNLYGIIHRISQVAVVHQPEHKENWTAKIDRIVLDRWLSLPLFLGVMYCLFFVAIHLGGLLQEAFNILSMAICVDGPTALLQHYHAPSWVIALLPHGIGKGINTTFTFIPVLTSMFLCMAFLEQSGYMARAAFAMDRIMRAIGLPGKAFVPLIVGFGCNVPAIMATRTLSQPRDRILTCLMAPFMSCGARLAIYAVFTSAFFPVNGHNIVFALYLLGIGVAVATGFIVRHTLLPGMASPMVMDLPRYQWPTWSELWQPTQLRTFRFITRAGAVILPLCAILGMLLSLDGHGHFISDDQVNTSILAVFAKQLTPLFQPMGISQDNWPATVGLLTGSMAKEVVIATLNTLYNHFTSGTVAMVQDVIHFNLWISIQEAGGSIIDKLQSLPQALFNPFAAAAPDQTFTHGVYGVMISKFAGKAAAFSYLVFVLLYVPCFSTIAVTARELNRGWAVFSLCWSLLVAYSLAVISYQLATWSHHPWQSLAWMVGLITLLALVVASLWYWRHQNDDPPPTFVENVTC